MSTSLALWILLAGAAPEENCPYPLLGDELPAWSECKVDPFAVDLILACPRGVCPRPCEIEVAFAVPPSANHGLADRRRAYWSANGDLLRVEFANLLAMGVDDASGGSYDFVFEGGLLQASRLIVRLTSRVDSSVYHRDSQGRVSSIELRQEAGGQVTVAGVIRYRRDVHGRVIAVERPGGVVNEVGYDARGRIAWYGRKSWLSRYDWRGDHLSAITEGNAVALKVERDDRGRIVSLRYPRTGEGVDVTRDGEGRVIEERPIPMAPDRRVRRFEYDCLDGPKSP